MPRDDRVAGRLRARQGITLPLIVLMIAMFVGMTALAIDISRMWLIRAELQTSADAGAIAGAMQLLTNDAGARAVGYDSAYVYTQLNKTEGTLPDVTAGDITPGTWDGITFTGTGDWTTANAVSVATHHTGSYIFGPIYDKFEMANRGYAIAAVGSVNRANCVRPLALPYVDLLKTLFDTAVSVTYSLTDDDIVVLANNHKIVDLKQGDPHDQATAGNYNAVRMPPAEYEDGTIPTETGTSGAMDYRAMLGPGCGSLDYLVGVGDWLEQEQGNMVGPTRFGIGDVCGYPAPGTPASFTCQNIVDYIVPIWDIAGVPPNVNVAHAVHVKYIGVFRVTAYLNGDIQGYFKSMYGAGSFTPNPGPLLRAALVK